MPLLLLGCATEAPEPTASCGTCHGSDATGPAPPMALGGFEDRDFRGVGAHAAHMNAALSAPVACTECHLVPATVDAPGHIDDAWPAEMTWGPLGTTGDTEITWDSTALSCSGSYCHGATMQVPGPDAVPLWTDTSAPQTTCGSCHLFPPPAPHPDGACVDCHAPTAVGNELADTTTHIDGVVQIDTRENCAAGCHGDAVQPAPPADLAGNDDPSNPGVGAHSSHRVATLGVAVACESCHPVPGSANDIGSHIDGSTDVVFEGIANNGGVSASYDPGAATCATYCHGASLGASDSVWTTVDGSQIGCGSCHGNPPPSPHPQNSNCTQCHSTGGAGDPAAHIDGSVSF